MYSIRAKELEFTLTHYGFKMLWGLGIALRYPEVSLKYTRALEPSDLVQEYSVAVFKQYIYLQYKRLIKFNKGYVLHTRLTYHERQKGKLEHTLSPICMLNPCSICARNAAFLLQCVG